MYTHTHIHTRAHTHTHSYTHTCTHPHTHTHHHPQLWLLCHQLFQHRYSGQYDNKELLIGRCTQWWHHDYQCNLVRHEYESPLFLKSVAKRERESKFHCWLRSSVSISCLPQISLTSASIKQQSHMSITLDGRGGLACNQIAFNLQFWHSGSGIRNKQGWL